MTSSQYQVPNIVSYPYCIRLLLNIPPEIDEVTWMSMFMALGNGTCKLCTICMVPVCGIKLPWEYDAFLKLLNKEEV